MQDISVGLRAPYDAPGGAAALARFAAQVEETSIDRVCVGDHVTFSGGRGFDGLLNATALAMVSRLLRDRAVCEKLRGTDKADALYALLTDRTESHAA